MSNEGRSGRGGQDDRQGRQQGRSAGRGQGGSGAPRRDSGASGSARGGPQSGNPRAAGSGGGTPDRGRGAAAARGGSGGRRGQASGSSQNRGASRVAGRTADEASRRSEDQQRYDGPPIPDDVTARELDKNLAVHLRGLPDKLAARVARHLVAAGRVIDEDPETAYQHTLAARARAARVAIVREATGEAAYAAGHFAEALSELRAARRMTGSADHLPVMADCERALGRPERALQLAKDPAVEKLAGDQKVEMQIVAAGARADMGDVDGAIRALAAAPLRSASREPWVARLRYAYADLLLAAGRREEALEWFHRTEAVDGEQLTDAAERVRELESQGVGVSPDERGR